MNRKKAIIVLSIILVIVLIYLNRNNIKELFYGSDFSQDNHNLPWKDNRFKNSILSIYI